MNHLIEPFSCCWSPIPGQDLGPGRAALEHLRYTLIAVALSA